MAARFDDGGIHFLYPENWRLEREDMPTTDEVAESALAALREEYPELEAEERVESLAGQPAVGHDINFFSLDLTNTCWTRSFYSARGTVLVLCQTSDLEPARNEQVLRAICASLRVDD